MERIYVTFYLRTPTEHVVLLARKVAIDIENTSWDIMPIIEDVGRSLLLEAKLPLHHIDKMKYKIYLKLW